MPGKIESLDLELVDKLQSICYDLHSKLTPLYVLDTLGASSYDQSKGALELLGEEFKKDLDEVCEYFTSMFLESKLLENTYGVYLLNLSKIEESLGIKLNSMNAVDTLDNVLAEPRVYKWLMNRNNTNRLYPMMPVGMVQTAEGFKLAASHVSMKVERQGLLEAVKASTEGFVSAAFFDYETGSIEVLE